MGTFRSSAPKFFLWHSNFVVSRKVCLNIYHNNIKIVSPNILFCLLNLTTWLQTWFMPAYTLQLVAFWQFSLLSLRMLVIPHIIFAVSWQEIKSVTLQNISWNANTETATLVISLTLMACMHKMLKTYNNISLHESKICSITTVYLQSTVFIFDGI